MKTTKYALAVALGLIALVAPGAARADDIVTIGATEYDISTVSTSFSADTAALESTPWWGNAALAANLAALVGDALGTPNLGSPYTYGPYFAWETNPNIPSFPDFYTYNATLLHDANGSTPGSYVWVYAVGSIVQATPEPSSVLFLVTGLLGLLGMGLYKRRCA